MYGVCLLFVLSADILKVFVSDKIRHKLTLTNVIWLNRIAGVCMIIVLAWCCCIKSCSGMRFSHRALNNNCYKKEGVCAFSFVFIML